jgi:hypothetical protein
MGKLLQNCDKDSYLVSPEKVPSRQSPECRVSSGRHRRMFLADGQILQIWPAEGQMWPHEG